MFLVFNFRKIIFCVAVVIISLSFIIGAVPTVTVTTLPLKEPAYIVVIDAGHGEPDGGAISKNGVKESELNLAIAQKLETSLKEEGYDVIMTRTDERNIADETMQDTIRKMKVSDINNRVKLVNGSGADVCVSIHMNKFASEKYYGWQTFYNKMSEYNKILAEEIQKGISENIDIENDRVPLAIQNVKLTDKSEIPTTIIECGFLSNSAELERLQTEEYREKLVGGIVNGINSYYEKMYGSITTQ